MNPGERGLIHDKYHLSEAEECEQKRINQKPNVNGVILKGNLTVICQCQLMVQKVNLGMFVLAQYNLM